MNIKKFQKHIWDFYVRHGRHDLPWRKNITPYRITVSEIMLQQTQVDRVIPFFQKWMKSFPSWKKLSQASTKSVLQHWKGLGYNSRGLRLRALAEMVVNQYHGRLPQDTQALRALPGIGPYTASAIRIFAYGKDDVCIETNIRRIFLYHFFNYRTDVHDNTLMPLIAESLPHTLPRHSFFTSHTVSHPYVHWYWALMDYGSQLPKLAQYNPNTKSRHYSKQSKFKGSDRQIRGRILGILLKEEKVSTRKLYTLLGTEKERYKKIVRDLHDEGFLSSEKGWVKVNE